MLSKLLKCKLNLHTEAFVMNVLVIINSLIYKTKEPIYKFNKLTYILFTCMPFDSWLNKKKNRNNFKEQFAIYFWFIYIKMEKKHE